MDRPRLLGMLCIRNEVSRYLQQCLDWHVPMLDEIFVYDDQSTDGSAEFARSILGGQSPSSAVGQRPNYVPSFLEHEGDFRQAAWEAMEIALEPLRGDWIFAFDADEFLVLPRATDPRKLLRDIANDLTGYGHRGVRLQIHEVFKAEPGAAFVRTDGFWGDITGVRFFEYRTGGKFANRRMACGSAPTYVDRTGVCSALELLHYGYARDEDKVEKHNRYIGLPGHNARHIASIISTPTLEPWHGAVPL